VAPISLIKPLSEICSTDMTFMF